MEKKFFVSETGVHRAEAGPVELIDESLLNIEPCHCEMIVGIAIMDEGDLDEKIHKKNKAD